MNYKKQQSIYQELRKYENEALSERLSEKLHFQQKRKFKGGLEEK